MKRLLLTLLALALATVTTTAQQEAILKSGDLKKLAKPFGKWVDAKLAGDPVAAGEAMGDLDDALRGLSKKLKGKDPLSLVADWEQVLEMGRNFDSNGKLMARGKVAQITFPSGIECLVRMPLKYTPTKQLYPTIVLIGKGAREAVESLDKAITDPFIILMPDVSDLEPEDMLLQGNFPRIGAPFGQASLYYAVDRRRLFLIGMDDHASALASRLASTVPHYFAGLANLGKDDGQAFLGKSNLSLIAQPESPPADLASALAWCAEAAPSNPYPTEFSYELGVPWQGRAFWMQAAAFDPTEEGTEATSHFKVSVDRESNTITLDSVGVTRVRIFLSDVLLDLDQPITVVRNGEPYTYQASRSLGTLLNNFASTLDRSVFPAMISSLDVPEAADSKVKQSDPPSGE